MAKQGLILANPAADLELPRLEKRLPRTILSVEQVEDIVSLCDLSTLQGIRDRALLELLWSTGIRRGEVARLEIYSADFSRHILTIVQGKPWEDYVGKVLPADARLPQNFKTFDYYDGATKTAVSAKSMDTQTMAKLANPNQVYSSIKGNINAAAKFERSELSGQVLNSSMITNREIQLAIPASTTKTQWA